ncbi:MAG TPA: hypothetical protein VJ256_07165, partial [Dehalococcoidia bacterium]|nr:hypothetical protein [Dehalococcoidia bacterium]
DLVLVGGVEKMTSLPTDRVTDALAAASDVIYEAAIGFTFPGVFAAIATAYLDRYGAAPEHLMRVAINNHENAALNPKAHFSQTIRAIMEARREKTRQRGGAIPNWRDEMDFLRDPQANPVVAWPLRLFDCSPISDGATCLLICAEEIAREFTDDPIRVVASAHASGGALASWDGLTSIPAARIAAQQAYEMAGIGPKEVQLAEVHDCFTIAEIVALEDLGLVGPGRGAWATAEGVTARDGLVPVNTSGGLKAKGHPVGATGAAQVMEIWHQLRGQAGARQVGGRDLRLGLAHNIGGTGGTCVVHILERR